MFFAIPTVPYSGLDFLQFPVVLANLTQCSGLFLWILYMLCHEQDMNDKLNQCPLCTLQDSCVHCQSENCARSALYLLLPASPPSPALSPAAPTPAPSPMQLRASWSAGEGKWGLDGRSYCARSLHLLIPAAPPSHSHAPSPAPVQSRARAGGGRWGGAGCSCTRSQLAPWTFLQLDLWCNLVQNMDG